MLLQLFIVSFLTLSAEAEYKWPIPSIPCRTEEQCFSIMGPTQVYKCSQGFCLCANLTTHQFDLCSNQEMFLTAKASGLRRNCTRDEDCDLVEGAKCLPTNLKDQSNKICLCGSERIESKDGQRCLKVVKELGASCEETAQCSNGTLHEGAECHQDRCRCKTSYHYGSSGRCVRNLEYNAHCEGNEEGCYEKHQFTGENLLVCSENYGCRCKKHWTFNHRDQHCVYSGASFITVQLSTIFLLVLMIGLF